MKLKEIIARLQTVKTPEDLADHCKELNELWHQSEDCWATRELQRLGQEIPMNVHEDIVVMFEEIENLACPNLHQYWFHFQVPSGDPLLIAAVKRHCGCPEITGGQDWTTIPYDSKGYKELRHSLRWQQKSRFFRRFTVKELRNYTPTTDLL